MTSPVNSAQVCGRCGRAVVRLKGRSWEGRLCSSCTAERHSGRCEVCGQHQRFDGFDPNGRRWCSGCRRHHTRPEHDAVERDRIVDIVATQDLGLQSTLASVTWPMSDRPARGVSHRRLGRPIGAQRVHLGASISHVQIASGPHRSPVGADEDGAGANIEPKPCQRFLGVLFSSRARFD